MRILPLEFLGDHNAKRAPRGPLLSLGRDQRLKSAIESGLAEYGENVGSDLHHRGNPVVEEMTPEYGC